VGRRRDVNSDAVVLRPVLELDTGLAVSQAVNPTYSKIDTYHMTACTIDEAVRRVVAVGADPDQIGGVDNFCWPSVQYDAINNPDGKFKAAQLVRANWALRDICLKYGVPLLSGKDSMYIDGNLPGEFGERHRVSGPETLQFTASGVVPDVFRCTTMDFKAAGELVYVLGITEDELGGSEYYDMFGYTGLNVPKVRAEDVFPLYRKVHDAIRQGLVSSVHGIYRGGFGVHLALCAMAGELGVTADLSKMSVMDGLTEDKIIFSETPGRFIVSISPENKDSFEELFHGLQAACVGKVENGSSYTLIGMDGRKWLIANIFELKAAWKKTFGDLI
jgi:phosphoribosylformylglycinamidine synthase